MSSLLYRIWWPNAGHEPLPEAEAERKLEAVGSMPGVRPMPVWARSCLSLQM